MQIHENLDIDELKDAVQDCNINFLIGSGLSAPYLSTLGKIEQLLTEVARMKEEDEITSEQSDIIRVSLYKTFFDFAILKNINILQDEANSTDILNYYKVFLKTINAIILHRKSTILNKQINIFTTNIDIFLEKALENIGVEYNDGFSGRFNPLFNLSNFKKSIFKTSLHYDNVSELPVFNLMKIHGSLTWKNEKNVENTDIFFDSNLQIVETIKEVDLSDNALNIKEIESRIEGEKKKIDKKYTITLRDLMDGILQESLGKNRDASIDAFRIAYEKLSIVNPTKEKFKETVLNRNYYELLRIYSNELEKENTVLFVMGFSFADEHIRDVTVRVANSNPTLKIYIFSHTSGINEGINKMLSESNNNNIDVIVPPKKEMKDSYSYNFKNLNDKVFLELLKRISDK